MIVITRISSIDIRVRSLYLISVFVFANFEILSINKLIDKSKTFEVGKDYAEGGEIWVKKLSPCVYVP